MTYTKRLSHQLIELLTRWMLIRAHIELSSMHVYALCNSGNTIDAMRCSIHKFYIRRIICVLMRFLYFIWVLRSICFRALVFKLATPTMFSLCSGGLHGSSSPYHCSRCGWRTYNLSSNSKRNCDLEFTVIPTTRVLRLVVQGKLQELNWTYSFSCKKTTEFLVVPNPLVAKKDPIVEQGFVAAAFWIVAWGTFLLLVSFLVILHMGPFQRNRYVWPAWLAHRLALL